MAVVKPFILRAVLATASPMIRKVRAPMMRMLPALVVAGAVTAIAPAAIVPGTHPAAAAGLIPEVGGGAVPSLAPMLSRITPGVVNIAVRGRVKEQNPLLQDPFFRRFFNLPQNQQTQERET